VVSEYLGRKCIITLALPVSWGSSGGRPIPRRHMFHVSRISEYPTSRGELAGVGGGGEKQASDVGMVGKPFSDLGATGPPFLTVDIFT